MSDNHDSVDPQTIGDRRCSDYDDDEDIYDGDNDPGSLENKDRDNTPVVTLAPAPDLSNYSEADKLTIRVEALQAVTAFQGHRINSQFSWRLLRLFERYLAHGLNAMDFPQYNKQYRAQSGRNYSNGSQRPYHNSNGYRRNNGGRY